MTTLAGPLEHALASADAPLDDVLDLVDAAVEQAAAQGDDATLARLAERLDETASERGSEWVGLAVAAARARALATTPGGPSSLPVLPAPPGSPSTPPRPAAKTETPPTPADRTQLIYAGWWRRVLALTFDAFVVGIALGVIVRVTGTPLGDVVLVLAYFAVFPAATDGITPGKAALGIAIRRADGTKMGLIRSFWRVISMWLLWVTVLGAIIDAILAGTDLKRQSLHDKLADTIVLRKRA